MAVTVVTILDTAAPAKVGTVEAIINVSGLYICLLHTLKARSHCMSATASKNYFTIEVCVNTQVFM